MKHKLAFIIIFILVLVSLAFSVKGHTGNPIYFQTERDTRVGGPFESSNSTSRYALVESIVRNNSLFLTQDLAKFTGGDLVFHNGKFLSIFTPGISFIGVPFYMLGKLVGMPQLFTYFSTLLFAIGNFYLVYKIGKKLGATNFESLIGGMVFLLGTNALPYALTLTQHHGSTFMILLSLLLSVSKRSIITNIALGAVFGIGVLMDIPNLFMMMPMILYAIFKSFEKEEIGEKLKLSLKLNVVGLLIGVLPFVAGFAVYNHVTTGSYTLLSQSIGRVDLDEQGNVKKRASETAEKTLYEHGEVFDPRQQLNGFYILFLSDERGILYYAPVIIVGLLGLFLAYKKKENKIIIVLSAGIALMCITCYTMFGDPWGGWSFGPRYLIPAIAIACTGIGIAIKTYKKNPIFILIFLLLVTYSVSVNSLGALTTNAIPPKGEALNLTSPIPYTYDYNLKLVDENRSSSLMYNTIFYRYSPFKHYLLGLISAQLLLILFAYVLAITASRKEIKNEK